LDHRLQQQRAAAGRFFPEAYHEAAPISYEAAGAWRDEESVLHYLSAQHVIHLFVKHASRTNVLKVCQGWKAACLEEGCPSLQL